VTFDLQRRTAKDSGGTATEAHEQHPDVAGGQGVGDEELGGRAVATEWREGNGELASRSVGAHREHRCGCRRP